MDHGSSKTGRDHLQALKYKCLNNGYILCPEMEIHSTVQQMFVTYATCLNVSVAKKDCCNIAFILYNTFGC